MSQRRPIRNKGAIAAARYRQTPSPGQRLAFRVDPWTRKLIRPLLITLLATSFGVALLVIVRISSPERAWMALVPLVFVAALEGTYTTAWLNNPDSRGVDRGIYRVVEIFLILLLARIYSWIVFGGGIPSPVELRLYLTAPNAVLSVGAFITSAFITLVAWWLAVTLSRIFAKLDVSASEISYYTLPAAEQKAKADDRPIQIPRETLLGQYLNTWLAAGMVMILITALSTFEVDQLTTVTNPFEIARLGMTPAMLFALLVYFLTGFWLLSHARLLRMNARWLMDGAAKEASLERQWQRSALLVILAVALIASFLPIGSSLGISRILSLGLNGIGYLAGILFTSLGNFFASALVQFTQDGEEMIVQTPEPAPQPTFEPVGAPPAAANPLATMIISSAFWAILIAIIIAAALFFLRERGYRLDRGKVQGYWLVAAGWLRELWAKLTGRAKSVRRGLRARIEAAGSAPVSQLDLTVPRPRFIRLNALSPRDQVRYYYLALVRRAEERGVRRRKGETPLEFARQLKGAWPESEDEFEALTGAFLEARYSPQPIEKREANSIKELWQRLKARLRARK